jgi:uncharacterized NAD(P)/FAD-binding protein YdhS
MQSVSGIKRELERSVSNMPGNDPRRRMPEFDVAIVGGGASGTLAAIHLLRSISDPGLRVAVFEPDPVRRHLGIAYGSTDTRHLLNLRAQVMSAFPDEPGHFAEWAATANGQWSATDFLPRMVYGRYLRDLVLNRHDDRMAFVDAQVHELLLHDRGFEVRTDDGAPVRARTVVLGYGVAAPRRLFTSAGPLPDAPWHLQSPWDLARLGQLPDDDTIVLVGSGLTAVDCAMTLLGDSPNRRVVMVSRRGDLPRRHHQQLSSEWDLPVPPGPLTAGGIARLLYDQIALANEQGVNWRAVVDGVRPHAASIWRRLDLHERRRFLADYAHTWHIHRNRIAPQIAERIDAYRKEGRLAVLDGGIREITDLENRCQVGVKGTSIQTSAVVNCTGPLTDISMTTNPLLRVLLTRGLIAADPLRLGVACSVDGQLLDRRGNPVPRLYALGPPTRYASYEAMSVPAIRDQAARLGQVIASTVLSGDAVHAP